MTTQDNSKQGAIMEGNKAYPTSLDVDNPRLQCERCGKWRRLITRGKQIMFPYSADMEGFKGEKDYSILCEPCRKELEND